VLSLPELEDKPVIIVQSQMRCPVHNIIGYDASSIRDSGDELNQTMNMLLCEDKPIRSEVNNKQ
jgi:hypothetical protein